MSREDARRRVMQRLGLHCQGAPMGAYPWYGVGLVGWYLGPEDKQQILASANNLANAVADLRGEVAKISSASTRGPWEVRLNGIDKTIAAHRASTESGAIKTKLVFERVLAYLNVAGPREIATMRPLILTDQQDPSGASSNQAIKDAHARIAAENKARAESFAVDPYGAMKRAAEGALKAAEDAAAAVGKKAIGFQWGVIKAFWPILLFGGGIAALWYFGPALGVVAKRLAGRVPGELPPGTQHQPGE